MPEARSSVPPGDPALTRGYSDFCEDIFGDLPRRDQRRWGSVYLQGLLCGSGRRTIRQAAELAGDSGCEQSLQQFVNQSPWDEDAVRRRVAERVHRDLHVDAWVVHEVAFPKHGRLSAGVERQFVHSEDRLINCQLGVTVLAGTPVGHVPLTWRLLLPPAWDRDPHRRHRAHVPEEVRHQPVIDHVAAALDTMTGPWGLPLVPVVMDASRGRGALTAIDMLEARQLRYVVQAAGHELALACETNDATRRPGRPPSPEPLVAIVRRIDTRRQTLDWPTVDGRPARSHFVAAPVHLIDAATRRRVPRLLVADWPLGRPAPRSFWLTNVRAALPDLVGLAHRTISGRRCIAAMAEHVGLTHFEGRSFRGWHHHVTLVSAAQAYRRLAAGAAAT